MNATLCFTGPPRVYWSRHWRQMTARSKACGSFHMTTERIVFSGHVQGVGFRYTVHSLARRNPVTGYVRNQSDGTVELVVQGSPAAINAFVADVHQQFAGNIQHCQRESLPSAAPFDRFEIRF